MSDLIGYARVSTTDQDHVLQRNALDAAGCTRTFTETASGALRDRPELGKVLDYLRPGDTLVVWKLDRLGRSISHLIEIVTALGERGIGFRSLTEGFDTTTSGGKLIFHVMAALAEFERDVIRERTTAGLAAARAEGRVGGRPSKLTGAKLEHACALRDAGQHTVTAIAEIVGVSRSTIYRALGEEPAKTPVRAGGR